MPRNRLCSVRVTTPYPLLLTPIVTALYHYRDQTISRTLW
nr:MAG TPA: hypothetical protein [Caudoviricetes sp.]DAU06176.1 MAG TPA: hypothetical protein [Caudoviricetes sp.]